MGEGKEYEKVQERRGESGGRGVKGAERKGEKGREKWK